MAILDIGFYGTDSKGSENLSLYSVGLKYKKYYA